MSIATIGTGAHTVRAKDATGHETKPHPEDSANATETIRKLRASLEWHAQRRARQAGWTRQFIPTGLTPLDTVLPHGGVPCGAITEIFSDGPGVGAMSLAMRMAAQCVGWHGQAEQVLCERGQTVRCPGENARWRERRHIILLDALGDFYPPAARQYGLAFDRLIVLRTRNTKDALWAVDQSLRCSAVAAVIAPLAQLDERDSRRLQLAAESSGGIGLILKPAARRVKSFAVVQMLVESLPVHPTSSHEQTWDSYRCHITLLAAREGMPTEPIRVDLHHETVIGPLHSVPVDRSAAKIA